MAKVEVRFCTVVGHKHFAVLKGRHRAWIDVEIRIEFHHRHAESAIDEQSTEGRGRNAFAERRNDATGHEDVLGCAVRRAGLTGRSLVDRHEASRRLVVEI